MVDAFLGPGMQAKHRLLMALLIFHIKKRKWRWERPWRPLSKQLSPVARSAVPLTNLITSAFINFLLPTGLHISPHLWAYS